jgi:O-antigen/teichoic acid export membrane protein
MIFEQLIKVPPRELMRSLWDRLHHDSLLRNSIFIMSTTIATSAVGYIYWIVAAHLYTPQNVGLASALISALLLTSTLSNLGIGSTLVQMLPRTKNDHDWSLTINAGLVTGTVSGLLAGGIVVALLPLFSPQFAVVWHPVYALLYVVGVPLAIATTLIDQTFVAERTSSGMLIRNASFAVIKLILMILPVLLLSIGALGIFSSYVLALAASLLGASLLLVPRLKRAYQLSLRGIVTRVRAMVSSLAGNHFINVGGLAPMGLLPVFVTIQLSAADNAYFYTATMVGDFFFVMASAVAVSLFAEGSYAATDLAKKVRSSALILSALLIPAMLVVFIGGRYILLLFGPGYVQHGLPVLLVDTVAAVPDAVTNIYISVLRVQGRLRRAAILNLGMAALTLILAWILLPIFGVVGAAMAVLIAQTAGCVVTGFDYLRFRLQPGRNEIATVPTAQDEPVIAVDE